jgi:anti-sigma regulatory factor (Ser/Thr protein kinase)
MWNATIPQDPTKIGVLRHAADRHLAAAGVRADREAVILMISELLTNALRHGRPPATISVNARPQRVHVTVCDASAEEPEVLPLDPTRVGGNGMRIVETLATRWGYDRQRSGKAVWFEVEA